jgi:hypothetical protein
MMLITKQSARRLGPALPLGDIAKPTKQPRSKTECKRKHTWNVRALHRWCSRCGLQEELNIITKEWERFGI